MRHVRGARIAMIFQEPMTSLNPVFTIGSQIGEAVRLHQQTNRAETRNRTIEALRMVGIADPERRIDDYPHQLSGGMRQRVMIAMALSCNPQLLIADEPTTALDVTIQAQILDLIRELQVRLGLAVILVTHDLGIVAEYADDVTILYAARVMEQAPTAELFRNPLNPYTRGLLESIPGIDGTRHHRLQAIPGSIPSALHPPSGCRFHPRCPRAIPKCSDGRSTARKQGPQPLCRLHPRLIPSRPTGKRVGRGAGSRRESQQGVSGGIDGHHRRDQAFGKSGGRRQSGDSAGRDAGIGGRVGLGKIDAGAADSETARADRGRGVFRRPRSLDAWPRGTAHAAPADAAGVSGSVRVVESADARAIDRRRRNRDSQTRARRGKGAIESPSCSRWSG